MQESEKSSWKEDWDKNDARTFENLKDDDYSYQVLCMWSCFEFDTFIDIGPGIAFSEAWLLKRFDPTIQVIGFEPQSERFQKLSHFCYPGRLFMNAVSDVDGIIVGGNGFRGGKSDFQINPTDQQVDRGEYAKAERISLTIDTIASQMIRQNNTMFVWADVEGAEEQVLKGAVKSLSEGRIKGILLELHVQKDKGGYFWKDATAFLRQYGYKPVALFNIQPTHFDCIFSSEPDQAIDNRIPDTSIQVIIDHNKDFVDGDLEMIRATRSFQCAKKMDQYLKFKEEK